MYVERRVERRKVEMNSTVWDPPVEITRCTVHQIIGWRRLRALLWAVRCYLSVGCVLQPSS